MPIPDAPYYRILVAKIGVASVGTSEESKVDSDLLAILPDLWEVNAGKGATNPRLQYLYTLREAIGIWKASVWRDVDFTEADVDESLSQRMKNLTMMSDDAITEIALLERQAGSYVVGQPDIVGILEPVDGSCIDPSDPLYRGDARRRFRYGLGYPFGTGGYGNGGY